MTSAARFASTVSSLLELTPKTFPGSVLVVKLDGNSYLIIRSQLFPLAKKVGFTFPETKLSSSQRRDKVAMRYGFLAVSDPS